MKIAEGVGRWWHYHLRNDASFKALCGADVVPTMLPLSLWKVPFGGHFPKHPTFCEECDKLSRPETGKVTP